MRHTLLSFPPLLHYLLLGRAVKGALASNVEEPSHRLAYLEALYHVLNGYWLASEGQAVALAALMPQVGMCCG